MDNLKMYCLCLHDDYLESVKKLNYIPVGLGLNKFRKDWLRDNTSNNISVKNKYYGEYTFHYWLWKNYIDSNYDDSNSWIGFCQYRKFWSTKSYNLLPNTINEVKPLVLTEIPELYNKYDVILGNPYFINQFKIMKFLKHGLKIILKNPSYLFDKNKRNIKFHFDLMHGYKNLDKAIDLLEIDDRKDFNEFVNSKTSFNPQNMFICKSKKILKNYYSTIFPWLDRCEKLFGFKNLKTFGQIRIYTFLAERFMSYWFQKNTKTKTMPIVFYDIRKDIK